MQFSDRLPTGLAADPAHLCHAMNRLTAISLVLLLVGFAWPAWSGAPFSPTVLSLPPASKSPFSRNTFPSPGPWPQVLTEYSSWERERPAGYMHSWIGTGISGQSKRSFWRSSKTVPCWSRTTMPAESTEEPTIPDAGRWVAAFTTGELTPCRSSIIRIVPNQSLPNLYPIVTQGLQPGVIV